MFGAMAGVRCAHIPYIEPRGVPDGIGFWASDDFWLFVSDYADGEGFCTPESAQRYIESGSVLRDPAKPLKGNSVSHPDWHSHSWLNADEFELAIAAYLKAAGFQINTPRLPAPSELTALATVRQDSEWALSSLTEYWAVLAAMRCFEAQGMESRLVFWFDN